MSVAERMTIAEFFELPHERWASLVDGEVVVNAPRPRHQRVTLDLLLALARWCEAASGRGEATMPLGVVLDEHNYYEPDILWFREGRGPGRSDTTLQPLPDIAVEVRSPSTWRYDIGVKKARYEQHGLPELWLVDTAAEEVIVFRRASAKSETFDASHELARGDVLSSPLLPGFALALGELFGPQA